MFYSVNIYPEEWIVNKNIFKLHIILIKKALYFFLLFQKSKVDTPWPKLMVKENSPVQLDLQRSLWYSSSFADLKNKSNQYNK